MQITIVAALDSKKRTERGIYYQKQYENFVIVKKMEPGSNLHLYTRSFAECLDRMDAVDYFHPETGFGK